MKKEDKKIPFFAKFLEDQIKEEQVKGGDLTDWKNDLVVTHKYPSDSDEVTKPTLDIAHTLKYPSDGDEVTTPMMDEY